MDKDYWVTRLQLEPHPEGGYFRQTYKNALTTAIQDTSKHLSTSILFLLSADNPSHFHRLKSDETWYYHTGDSLNIHLIYPNGEYECVSLGLKENEHLQYTVPSGVIFGSSVDSTSLEAFAIVSCSVTPAFDYADFELFTQSELLTQYPQHRTIIQQLAYNTLP